jgi:homoserine kinase type II
MILKHYDLTPPITEFPLSQGVNNAIVGIRTGNGDYALKHFNAPHGLGGLKYEHDLLRWLTEQSLSFAVPAPIETRSGQTYYQDTNGLHILMPLLKGHRPNHQNPTQIQAIGIALGELQIALRNYPLTPRPNTVSFSDLNNIHPRIPTPQSLTPQDIGWPQTATTQQLCDWWREEVASLQAFLTHTYPHLPKQVIHGDMAPSNTLFQNNNLSAILDFEFSCPDVRTIDMASGLKFSMRIDENDNPWEIGAHFCKGYQKKIKLTELECTSLIDIMILRDVVSTIWWLGRNLDDNKIPETNRMEELRSFKTWLSTHRSQLEDLWSH